jgi:hypothetical protein
MSVHWFPLCLVSRLILVDGHIEIVVQLLGVFNHHCLPVCQVVYYFSLVHDLRNQLLFISLLLSQQLLILLSDKLDVLDHLHFSFKLILQVTAKASHILELRVMAKHLLLNCADLRPYFFSFRCFQPVLLFDQSSFIYCFLIFNFYQVGLPLQSRNCCFLKLNVVS